MHVYHRTKFKAKSLSFPVVYKPRFLLLRNFLFLYMWPTPAHTWHLHNMKPCYPDSYRLLNTAQFVHCLQNTSTTPGHQKRQR